MDPGGSEPDSSLSQTENPCLIVEDSQPDSAALEDDPDGSYRALLSRRLSSLQPTAHSPVLELISSPSVSRSPGAINHTLQTEARPSLEAQEHSQVVEVCSLGDAGRSTSKKMDSTTSAPTEEGMSQFGFLELSESQGIHDDLEKSGEKDEEEAETKNSTLDHLKPQVRTSQNPEDSQKMNIQTLLHSHAAGDGGDDLTSSQEDLFDGEQEDERPGEAEKRSLPTSTPAHSLHLLHLSGQGTLVQESLSQQSVEFVAATQERMSQTPLIVPNSPTGDELMDTSQPAGDQSLTNEEEPKGSKPEPPASTPVSQNSPGFVLDKSLSVPSQPEFSHDVFVATLSQEKPTEKSGTPASTDVAPGTAGVTLNTPRSGTSPEAEDTGSFQLELSTTTQPSICAVNTQAFLQDGDEDSQATQIEELESVPQNSGSRECARDGDALVTTARNVKQSLSSEGVVTAKHLNSGPAPTSPRAPHPASQSQSQSILSIYAAPKPQTEPTTQEEPSVTSDPQRGDQEVKEDVEEVVEETQKGCGVPPNTNTTCSPICLEESQRGSQQKSQATPTTQPPHGSAQAAGGSTRDGATVMPALGQGRRSLSHSQPEASSAKQAVEATPRSQSQGLSDSSGDTPFHFTLPKDGELMRPAVGSTPPLVSHLKKTPRHSTPIGWSAPKKSPFSEQLEGDVTPGTTMADSDLMVAEESGREPAAGNSGKLSLRMKLVTPVEEVSSGSEHFSLQKPSLSDEEGSVSTATTAAKVVSSPTVFSRVREVHRRVDGAEDVQPAAPSSPFSGGSFNSPIHGDGDSERKSRPHPQPSSRPAPRPAPSEPITSTPQQELMGNGPGPAEETGPPKTPPRNRAVSQQTSCEAPGSSSSSSKLRQRAVSQQTSFDAPGPNKSGWAPAGTCVRRVVRTVQEVRTTVTRTVTEVYYEDGREVERRVSEESDEPVVECRVLDQDVSPSRTGSSLTSGDLADVSSLSSKASSLAHSSSSGGTAPVARHPDFIVPTSRGAAKSAR
ncbi:TP53-binding protein 1 isoform X2 [Denticeps clupeoides]|uniref:TP53-binding protein 1 isoform X2 n=1 Tax=Denticeps clupeoides TaxID=299321 RepID=UPI0010A4C1EE|nr:TP53-binding protein 1 isoform X2 [Denticeps clupeoides]